MLSVIPARQRSAVLLHASRDAVYHPVPNVFAGAAVLAKPRFRNVPDGANAPSGLGGYWDRRRLIQPGDTARSRAVYRRSRPMTAAPQIAPGGIEPPAREAG
jgi:hypothetical protein